MSTQRHRQQRALVCKRKIKVRNEIKGKNPDQKGKNNEQDTVRFYESNKRMAKSQGVTLHKLCQITACDNDFSIVLKHGDLKSEKSFCLFLANGKQAMYFRYDIRITGKVNKHNTYDNATGFCY